MASRYPVTEKDVRYVYSKLLDREPEPAAVEAALAQTAESGGAVDLDLLVGAITGGVAAAAIAAAALVWQRTRRRLLSRPVVAKGHTVQATTTEAPEDGRSLAESPTKHPGAISLVEVSEPLSPGAGQQQQSEDRL